MSPHGHWRRRRTAWRFADAVLAVCLLAGVVLLSNLDHMPRGLAGFLALRVSIKNALLIAAFAWAWPFVLSHCGLHSPSRLRTGDGEWSRLVLAGAVGCILASVFSLTSRSGLVGPLVPVDGPYSSFFLLGEGGYGQPIGAGLNGSDDTPLPA